MTKTITTPISRRVTVLFVLVEIHGMGSERRSKQYTIQFDIHFEVSFVKLFDCFDRMNIKSVLLNLWIRRFLLSEVDYIWEEVNKIQ